MQVKLTLEDVTLYLKAILGKEPVPDAEGLVRMPCVFPFFPPHDIVMKVQSGDWTCVYHGRGQLDDFECGRSRLFGYHEGERAVLRMISTAKEAARKAEEARKAARDKQIEDLSPSWRSLLRVIDRHPEGIARRPLQQRSHMRSAEFRKGLKELERRSSIRSHWVPTRRRRRPKITYFPVANSEALGDKESELARKTDAARVS